MVFITFNHVIYVVGSGRSGFRNLLGICVCVKLIVLLCADRIEQSATLCLTSNDEHLCLAAGLQVLYSNRKFCNLRVCFRNLNLEACSRLAVLARSCCFNAYVCLSYTHDRDRSVIGYGNNILSRCNLIRKSCLSSAYFVRKRRITIYLVDLICAKRDRLIALKRSSDRNRDCAFFVVSGDIYGDQDDRR